MIEEARVNLRTLLAIPDTHHVEFCPGGATLQFAMAPMNLSARTPAPPDYVVTGTWGSKAVSEAARLSGARVAWTGADEGFVRVPAPEELGERLAAETPYVHLSTNETIQGVQFVDDPRDRCRRFPWPPTCLRTSSPGRSRWGGTA